MLLPLFPLNTVLFPHSVLPIHVFEQRYRQMIAYCLERNANFGVVLIRSGKEVGGSVVPFSIGTEATIVHAQKLEDGRFNIITKGVRKFKILELDQSKPYLQGRVVWLSDTPSNPAILAPLKSEVEVRFRAYLDYLRLLGKVEFEEAWHKEEPEAYSYTVANALRINLAQKQELLELSSAESRLKREAEMLDFFKNS